MTSESKLNQNFLFCGAGGGGGGRGSQNMTLKMADACIYIKYGYVQESGLVQL